MRTIVLYEYPAASRDISGWEEFMEDRILDSDKSDPVRPKYFLENEVVDCYPLDDIIPDCFPFLQHDKLIIVGCVSKPEVTDALVYLLQETRR